MDLLQRHSCHARNVNAKHFHERLGREHQKSVHLLRGLADHVVRTPMRRYCSELIRNEAYLESTDTARLFVNPNMASITREFDSLSGKCLRISYVMYVGDIRTIIFDKLFGLVA